MTALALPDTQAAEAEVVNPRFVYAFHVDAWRADDQVAEIKSIMVETVPTQDETVLLRMAERMATHLYEAGNFGCMTALDNAALHTGYLAAILTALSNYVPGLDDGQVYRHVITDENCYRTRATIYCEEA